MKIHVNSMYLHALWIGLFTLILQILFCIHTCQSLNLFYFLKKIILQCKHGRLPPTNVLWRFAHCKRQTAVAADTYGNLSLHRLFRIQCCPLAQPSITPLRQSWIGICLKYVEDFVTERDKIEIYRRMEDMSTQSASRQKYLGLEYTA